ncbi:hypothetical protein CENSYa_0764 [Cenarchaeum symbiosum A]|uniref:Uncharacterized protein n=1 Tax=Cenarchaeum symbiosum (strain A) TaxID=414004 RepID=A0RVN0_CENSY|nr:hypothetical protein CENSYa_0764 [Cenarchaeum symbiosum A]
MGKALPMDAGVPRQPVRGPVIPSEYPDLFCPCMGPLRLALHHCHLSAGRAPPDRIWRSRNGRMPLPAPTTLINQGI